MSLLLEKIINQYLSSYKSDDFCSPEVIDEYWTLPRNILVKGEYITTFTDQENKTRSS